MGDSFKFIHCSDLHLGCGFSGISDDDQESGKKLKESVFKALSIVMTTAKKEKVDFILFSGDIFDSGNETPLTRSRFADALATVKIPCFIAYGNHDAERKWESSIPLPKNAFVFPKEVSRVYLEKNGSKFVEIIGASFDPARPRADPTAEVSKESDLFSIGLFHCTVDGASDDVYAPCKSQSLKSKGIDYWALGHIHKRAVLSENPHIVYPGNTQGMDRKETGEKGAYIVSVENGKVSNMTFFRTGEILWQDVSVDITGRKDLKSLVNAIAGSTEKGSLVNLTFTGRGEMDAILRLEPGSIKETVESGSGCRIVHMDIRSFPDMDLEARKDTGDFISAVINFGKRLEHYRKGELIDIICSTSTSRVLRPRYEMMSEEELKTIVRDSMYLVIEKMTEAGR